LYNDHTFSVRIAPFTPAGDPTFPFWFEITYASRAPLPIHVLAPGCDVVDRGSGVEITGPFTLDLLRSTIDDGSRGYRYTPFVTAGPYRFVSYDASAFQIVLEVNDRYLGSGPERIRPLIQQIIFNQVAMAVAIDALATGAIDLMIQAGGAVQINPGLDLVDRGAANYVTYARNGYGRITFHCDWGPTQFAEVRRAIAFALDREEFVRQFTGGWGVIVHSRVGMAQWMFERNRDILERDLTVYSLNVDRAREELIAGGWTLNAQGGAYTTGTRHKRMPDGSLMALVIEWFSPDANVIGEMLATHLTANAVAIGMEIRQDWGDTVAFGNALAGRGKRYNMINGGVGFAIQDSPWFGYSLDESLFGTWNSNFILDEPLARYTQQMRNTTPGDYDSFSASWLNFVRRFNDILPDLPLYSDEWFDFFTPRLQDYTRNSLYPWTSSILKAWVSN
jgi:peptide/nickel transport system substrate-binding protein